MKTSLELACTGALSLGAVALLAGTAAGLAFVAVLTLAAIGFAVPFAILGLGTLAGLAKYVAWWVETSTGRDLTGDHIVGRPALPAPKPEREIVPMPVRSYGNTVKLAGAEKGFCQQDLAWMLDQLPRRGVTWAEWEGTTLPSGKRLTSYGDYRAFPDLLASAGILRNRGPRQAGYLATLDTSELRELLL